MRFRLTDEQRAFGDALDALLSSADTVGAARSWADGDHAPGLKLWSRLAEQGVTALLVPEEHGGMGATPVEMAVALEALGRHAVPGPWVESVAYLPASLTDADALGSLAEGTVGTVAAPPEVPYALDADVADLVFVATVEGVVSATAGDQHTSVDPARRLFEVGGFEAQALTAFAPQSPHPVDMAALAAAAQLLGAGERVLADSVGYVQQRRQFGRAIGSYQATKHRLADVRIALDFARPLVYGAALDPTARAVSAAKVACGDAAYLASRAGLQVHGAIGYTQEYDLSLWLTKIRALVSAWGSPAFHRARVLESLVGPSTSSGTE